MGDRDEKAERRRRARRIRTRTKSELVGLAGKEEMKLKYLKEPRTST